MSPEILLGQEYDESSDVYSFGIVMYELFFEIKPFQSGSINPAVINPVNIGIMVAQNGLRPPIPDQSNERYQSFSAEEIEYLGIMKECWDQNKSARPTFEDVHSRLTKIANNDLM